MKMLIENLNWDGQLRRLGAYYTVRISIIRGEDCYDFDIDSGRVSQAEGTPDESGRAFSLEGSAEAWDRFCEDTPPPEHHELGALLACGHVAVHGNAPAMNANFMYVRRLLEIWREHYRGLLK